MKTRYATLIIALFLALSALSCNMPTALPTATLTLTPSTTPTLTLAPSATLSPTLTLSPTPSATPSPTTPPETTPNAHVRAEPGFLRLRAGPGTVHDVVTKLDDGALLVAVARAGEGGQTWLKVIAPAYDAEGWVLAAYVQADIDIAGLPDTGDVVTNATPVPAGGGAAEGGLIWGISSNARAIYLRGLQMGNRGDVFSKVGDSITATWVYLYHIGYGNYELHDYQYLQEVIDFFSVTPARGALNSFEDFSLAAWGGWTTRDVLDPGRNQAPEAGVCAAGETPLECEYRASRPATAIIMLGTNDSVALSAGEFGTNMRRIIEISINQGVIPVLSTIPPKRNEDPHIAEFNDVIKALAREYDIPLMDYWLALSDLPNYGISDDTVHPASPPGGDAASVNFTAENLQYGAVVRNLLTLQMLDALWRTVFPDYVPPPP